MKLIVISNPLAIEREHDIVNALFSNGLEYFHLRKPNYTVQDMIAYIEKINPAHQNKVILHQHHPLALELGLKGIHYNRHQPFNLTDATRHKDIQQSASCHSLQEVTTASPLLSYVFLSPVFDSISKLSYNASFDFEELSVFLKARTAQQPEVIALGGVNENTAATAKQLGFNGVAVMGVLWSQNTSENIP